VSGSKSKPLEHQETTSHRGPPTVNRYGSLPGSPPHMAVTATSAS
jgi:hypothetical protein